MLLPNGKKLISVDTGAFIFFTVKVSDKVIFTVNIEYVYSIAEADKFSYRS